MGTFDFVDMWLVRCHGMVGARRNCRKSRVRCAIEYRILALIFQSRSGSLITGIIALLHPNYVLQRWHVFLIFEVWMLGAFLINTFGVRLLPGINRAALTWSIVGVVVISITCLACASPNYESGRFVFGGYVNETGWNNGVAWILGLLQSAFGLTGFDA
jgi:choline transport protein